MQPRLSSAPSASSSACSSASFVSAQQPAPAAPPAVPPLVTFAGTLPGAEGPMFATFALYAEASGGEALWSETQAITVASTGHFIVLLGATQPERAAGGVVC